MDDEPIAQRSVFCGPPTSHSSWPTDMPNDFIYCLANNYFILTQNHVSILRSLHQLVDLIRGVYMERRQRRHFTFPCKTLCREKESLSLGQGWIRNTLRVIILHAPPHSSWWQFMAKDLINPNGRSMISIGLVGCAINLLYFIISWYGTNVVLGQLFKKGIHSLTLQLLILLGITC